MFKKMREKAHIRRAEEALAMYSMATDRYIEIRDTKGQEAADAYAQEMNPILDAAKKRAQR